MTSRHPHRNRFDLWERIDFPNFCHEVARSTTKSSGATTEGTVDRRHGGQRRAHVVD
ncbi:hypothetical protein [Pinisolibacter sp.]|uniref:hypothetical protein n=1 Tax=Pinisolibacter sp. TaxID=2172024 RepID=UPI002FDEE9DA